LRHYPLFYFTPFASTLLSDRVLTLLNNCSGARAKRCTEFIEVSKAQRQRGKKNQKKVNKKTDILEKSYKKASFL